MKSSYDNFVQPSSKFADIVSLRVCFQLTQIVPGHHNDTAIELLVTHLQRQLDARSLRFRRELVQLNSQAPTPSEELSVQLLPQTNQLLVSWPYSALADDQSIMTILRNANTKRSEFIFYADRLSTLIVEEALANIPRASKDIRTANGVPFHGVDSCDSVSGLLRRRETSSAHSQSIVGVSILRSGGPFANGLRRVIRDVPLGAMLIQSDPKTGEPLLLNAKLPESLHSWEKAGTMQVLLLDSQMGTGAAACEFPSSSGFEKHQRSLGRTQPALFRQSCSAHSGGRATAQTLPRIAKTVADLTPVMAIRVLLDHGVPREYTWRSVVGRSLCVICRRDV